MLSSMDGGGMSYKNLGAGGQWQVSCTSPSATDHTLYFAANMSIFYQIPQYALLGLGEAFTNVAGLEFAYTHAPRDLQALVTGLYWLFSGFGSLLGLAIVQISHSTHLLYSSDRFDINYRVPCPYSNGTFADRTCGRTHLDNYFFILAGVQLFGVLMLILVSWGMGLEPIGLTAEAGSLRRSRDDGESQYSVITTPASTIVNASVVGNQLPPGDAVRAESIDQQTRLRFSVP